MDKIVLVSINKIIPDKNQPRKEFDPLHLSQLIKSIKQKGVINPLVVEEMGNGNYLLVDGERRYRASKEAGLEQLPVRITEPLDETSRLVLRFHLQENSRQWSTFDKARAIEDLVTQGLSTNDLIEMLNVTGNQLRHFRMILLLSKNTQDAITDKRIPMHYAQSIGTMVASLKGLGLEKYSERLQEALTDKIERAVYKTKYEIRSVSIAISQGGEEIVENIIKIRDYSAEKALRDSNAGELRAYKTLMTNLSYIEANFNKAIENSLFKLVDEHGHNALKRAINKLTKFMKLADIKD